MKPAWQDDDRPPERDLVTLLTRAFELVALLFFLWTVLSLAFRLVKGE